MPILQNLKDFSWLYIFIAASIFCYCVLLKCNEYKAERNAAIAESKTCSVYLDQQNTAVDNMQKLSMEQNIKKKKSEELAASNMEKAKKEAFDIINSKSPSDCEGGRLYLIGKAMELNK